MITNDELKNWFQFILRTNYNNPKVDSSGKIYSNDLFTIKYLENYDFEISFHDKNDKLIQFVISEPHRSELTSLIRLLEIVLSTTRFVKINEKGEHNGQCKNIYRWDRS